MNRLAVALCGLMLAALPSTSALADTVYDFSFSGTFSGSGQFTAIPDGVGTFLVTGITGTTDGLGITGLLPVGTFQQNDNLLHDPGPTLDVDGLSYILSNGEKVNLFFSIGVLTQLPGSETFGGEITPITITLDSSSPVPEPSTLALLSSGALGLAGMARRKLLI